MERISVLKKSNEKINMKILTSPAKLMKVGVSSEFIKPTEPPFIEDSAFIQSYLKEKTPNFLAELMELSPKLADENWERNQNWKKNPSENESAPALLAFTGEVYRGLDAPSLDKKAIDYLQEHYRMLSGLYGLLKPSDRIMLYRLEMGRKFQFDKYKNLYEFWSDKITEQLNSELNEGELLLNLASNEYFKVVNRKKLHAQVVEHARGLVVRFCAENNVRSLEELKAFGEEGYLLNDELSTENKLVFMR